MTAGRKASPARRKATRYRRRKAALKKKPPLRKALRTLLQSRAPHRIYPARRTALRLQADDRRGKFAAPVYGCGIVGAGTAYDALKADGRPLVRYDKFIVYPLDIIKPFDYNTSHCRGRARKRRARQCIIGACFVNHSYLPALRAASAARRHGMKMSRP